MEMGLEGQRVVVIGGAQGIGWSTAEVFAEEGAEVVIWDRQRPTLRAAPSTSADWEFHSVDVTKIESLEEALAATRQSGPTPRHVVLTAAIGSGRFGFPFDRLSPEDWHAILQVNIMGMVHVAHLFAEPMRRAGGGSMTFLGSVAGQMGSQTDPPYSASKAANINFMQCLAKDLAPHQVRVNIVNPGMVQTSLNRSVWAASQEGLPADQQESYESWAMAKIQRVVPLGRWQTTREVASMIVYLASKHGASITGQCLNVDGGFVMRG